MFATKAFPVWSLLLSLGILLPICLAQSREKDLVEDATSGVRVEPVMPTPNSPEDRSLSPDFCDFTFHVPWSGSSCSQMVPSSSPASQEELDHLKILLEDIGKVLRTLQEVAVLEAGESRYQDIISEALPDIREANLTFHEILGKFLQELEEHIQVEDHPQAEDEGKKLKEHLRLMDHLLRVTGRLAEQLAQESQNLLVTLSRPLEKPSAQMYGTPLQPS